MGKLNRESREIEAKIVYFGPSGAGTSTNLEYIRAKLRREHRGALQRLRAPSTGAAWESLEIELGSVRGFRTTFRLHSVPASEGESVLRRRVLEGADGIVFVADLRPPHHDATVRALAELRGHLEDRGLRLEDLPLVVQYNRRDLADENALDALHRRLQLPAHAFFESCAPQGTGVLQTLTHLAKLVLKRIRQQAEATEADAEEPPVAAARGQHSGGPGVPAPEVLPTVTAEETGTFEGPLVEPATEAPELPPKGFQIASAGPVEGGPDELRVPLVLVEEGSGRRVALCLRLHLDAA